MSHAKRSCVWRIDARDITSLEPRMTIGPSPSSVMDIPISVQEALRDSITSGTFIDTKFWVFSKRGSKTGRRVGDPKALFVNGHVVRSVPGLGARMFVFCDRQRFLSH